MYQQQRIQALIEWLRRDGQLTTKQIMAKFAVSRETARRDMMAIVKLGQAQRTHGGIVQTQKALPVLDYLERQHQFSDAKTAMAAAALPLIEPHMTLFLDVSTTVLALCQQLHEPATVFTDSLDNALTLATHPNIDLHLLGGRFEAKNRLFYSRDSLTTLANVTFDIAVLGPASLDAAGIYVNDDNDAAMKRQATAQARKVIVLAEHQKFQKQTPYLSARWADIDLLITDQALTANEKVPSDVSVIVAGQNA